MAGGNRRMTRRMGRALLVALSWLGLLSNVSLAQDREAEILDETSPFQVLDDGQRLVTWGLVIPARRVLVPAKVEGILDQLELTPGTVVKAGDLIGELESRQARSAVNEATTTARSATQKVAVATAALEQSRLDWELAESDLARAKQSRERVADSVSDAELAKREFDVRRAAIEVELRQATLAADEAELELAEIRIANREAELADHRLVAPFDATVTQLIARPGQWCDRGDPILELIDTSHASLRLFVPAAWARLEPRQISARVWVDDQPSDMEVSVEFVAPEIDRVRQVVAVQLRLADERLIPGERVRVEVVRSEVTDNESTEDRTR